MQNVLKLKVQFIHYIIVFFVQKHQHVSRILMLKVVKINNLKYLLLAMVVLYVI